MTETNRFSFVYKKMIKLFWIMIGYGFLFFTIAIIKYFLKLNLALSLPVLRFWGLILCILTLLCGVTSSNLIRIIFQIFAKRRKCITMEGFLLFQNLVIVIPLSASFFAGLVFFLLIPQPYLYTSFLAALYGIYSGRPSRQRLILELKYYGLDV